MTMILPFPIETPATAPRTRGTADTSDRNMVTFGRDKGAGQRVSIPIELALSVKATLGQALNLLLAIVERGGNSYHRVTSSWPAVKEGGRARYGGIARSAQDEAAGNGFTYLYPQFQVDGEPVYLKGEGAEFVAGDRKVTGAALLENCWLRGYSFKDGEGVRRYINGLADYIGVVNASLPGLGLSVSAGDDGISMHFDAEFRKGPYTLERIVALEKMLASDAHPAVRSFLSAVHDSAIDAANQRAAAVTSPEAVDATEPDGDSETEPSER